MEGVVSLNTSSENVFLKPGDIAVYDKKNNRLNVAAGDVDFDRLWTKDKLLMSNESLGNVCRFLSKWYGVEINLEDGLKDRYMYTFTLRDEPLEETSLAKSSENVCFLSRRKFRQRLRAA